MFGRYTHNRTGALLRLGYYDEKYDAEPLFDRKRYTLDLTLTRDLNAVTSARLGVNYSGQKYQTFDHDFSDLKATLGLRWNFGRSSFVSLEYQYLDRNDDAGGDYNANELWLRFAYQVGGAASGDSFAAY